MNQYLNNWVNVFINFLSNQLFKDFVWNETHCSMLICKAWDSVNENNNYELWHKENYAVHSLDEAKNLCSENAGLKILEHLNYNEVDVGWQTGDVLYAFENGLECMHIYIDGKFISCFVDGKIESVLAYEYLKEINQKEIDYKIFRK